MVAMFSLDKSRPNVDIIVKDPPNFLFVKFASNWQSSFRGYDQNVKSLRKTNRQRRDDRHQVMAKADMTIWVR